SYFLRLLLSTPISHLFPYSTLFRSLLLIEDGIAHVRLNRPDKLNALDREMIAALIEVGTQLREEPALRVVIIAGVGKAFCSGLRSEEHTSELQSRENLVCRLLLAIK